MSKVKDKIKDAKTDQLAKRVAAHRIKYRVPGEPKRILCHRIGLSKKNRGGQIPNAHHIHVKIGGSLLNDGLDPERARIGEVVDYTEFPDKKREEIEHNQSFTNGSQLYPRVRPDVMNFSSVGSTHFTMALRLCEEEANSELTGRQFPTIHSGNIHCISMATDHCENVGMLNCFSK